MTEKHTARRDLVTTGTGHHHHVEAGVLRHDDPGIEPGSVDRVPIVDLWHHLHDRVAYGRTLRAALRVRDDFRNGLIHAA